MIELAFASDRPQTKRYLNHGCERTKVLLKDLHSQKLSDKPFSKNQIAKQVVVFSQFANTLQSTFAEVLYIQVGLNKYPSAAQLDSR